MASSKACLRPLARGLCHSRQALSVRVLPATSSAYARKASSITARSFHATTYHGNLSSQTTSVLPSSPGSTSPAHSDEPSRLAGPSAHHDPADHRTIIDWPDGQTSRFHDKWLYDHCRCDECFHAVTKQRKKGLLEIPKDLQPTALDPSELGLAITWSTGSHTSFFPWSILRKASYDPVLIDPSGNNSRLQEDDRILWNASIAKSPPTVAYAGLVGENEEAAEKGVWGLLRKVHEFGFCFISGVPVSPEETEKVIRRIGNIRETHYGGFWDFTADLKMGDMAYTNEALPAHTDNTYFTDPSGLQIFHMLSHPPPGQGGTSLLVDSFYTASILEQLHPDAYATLSKLPVPTHASGSTGTLLKPSPVPVLQHDQASGSLIQVRWNNEDRGVLGPSSHWTGEQIEHFYDAAEKWEECLRSPDSEYWVQLKPGMMVVIDNWRVMHGRSGFSGERRMCGAYVGRDEWRSRLEVLKRRFEVDLGESKLSPEEKELKERWRDGW